MTLETETSAPVAAEPSATPSVATETGGPDTPAPETGVESSDDDLRSIWSKHNPDRDDNGKFTAPSPGETETKLTDQPAIKPDEQPVAAITAPNSWSPEVKEAWASIPPKAQEFIAKREKEAHDHITRQGQEIGLLNPLRSVIERNADLFISNQVSPEHGIAALLQSERELAADPESAIEKLAEQYGVDLRAKYSGQSASSGEVQLRSQIAKLEQRLNETSGHIKQREAEDASRQHDATLSEITRFSSDKPDWAELENDILTEVTGLRAAMSQRLIPEASQTNILSMAYERAQRNNPAVWAKKQEAERKAEDARKVTEAQKRAEDAKRNKVVNINSDAARGSATQSMDDGLRSIYRKNHAK